MSAGLQLELLPEHVSPLFGTRVKFDGLRCCPHCSNKIAVIGRTTGPHFAELKCAACGTSCGWLSKSTASWLTTIINKFGAPTTPVILRRTT
jgi:hypothetical protein